MPVFVRSNDGLGFTLRDDKAGAFIEFVEGYDLWVDGVSTKEFERAVLFLTDTMLTDKLAEATHD